jgi:lysozyme
MIEQALPIALKIAKPFEGLSLTPYHDPAGYPTIGYGHLLSKEKWADLSQWDAISHDEAEALLLKDMSGALSQAVSASPVLGNDPKRLAAIGDFVYNLGIGQYRASTLKRKIDAKDWHGSREQIARWTRAGGRVLKGLVLRRAAEARLL